MSCEREMTGARRCRLTLEMVGQASVKRAVIAITAAAYTDSVPQPARS